MLTRLRSPYHRYARKAVLFTLASLLKRMPGNSLRVGPPRRSGRAGDARKDRRTLHRQPVVSPERLVFDEPRSITPQADFWSLVETSPDLGQFPRTSDGARYFDIQGGSVYTLPRGRVLGVEGWIVDADDRLLTDLSPDYLRERYIGARHPVMNRLRLPAVQSHGGTVAVLATLSARNYYGHWMMDLLPRAAMIRHAGVQFEDLDGIYMSRPRHQYQVELLTSLGIRMSQIIDADVVPHLRAAQLIVPSCHANVFIASKWCCDTLRGLTARTTVESLRGPRRIYVSRSGTAHRRVVNEGELLGNVLEPRGFVVVRPEQLTLEQQMATFAAADVIVMPLGSAVANLVHCRPGTQIVEIMNPRCVQPCALAIATQLDLGHHVVLAPGVDKTRHEINEDLFVPTARLERAVQQALSWA